MAQPHRSAAKLTMMPAPCNRNHVPGSENSTARVQAESGRAEVITDTSIPTDKERCKVLLGW